MRYLLAPCLLLVLGACDNAVSYGGVQLRPYFPFDGDRTWEFRSTDDSLDYRILAELQDETTPGHDGAVTVYTVSYSRKCFQSAENCDNTWIRDVQWSADGYHGVEIWRVESAAGTETYAPPIKLAQGEMLAGDTSTTTTGGATWTATFEGFDTCPVTWTEDWGNRCAKITLDDGGSGALAGEWWSITQYNVVAFQLTGDTGRWQLDYATYE